MAQYKDIIIPKGSIFNNADITGFYGASFNDTKQNQWDIGRRHSKEGEYEITAIVDRTKEDTAPFVQSKVINGFSVKIGTIVNIRLIKDVTNSIPKEEIIMTGAPTNAGTLTPNIMNSNSIFTQRNVMVGLAIIVLLLLITAE